MARAGAAGHDTNALGQPVGHALAGWQAPPPPPRENMEGRYCRLTPLDAAVHARALHAAYTLDRDGGMWTYMSHGPFDTEERYFEWAEHASQGADPMFFAIVDRKRGKPVGVASYMR